MTMNQNGNKLKTFILTLLITFVMPVSHSLANDAHGLKHITTNDGLSGLSVIKMTKDRTGNIWMVTSNGIDVYNGKEIWHVGIADAERGIGVHDICVDDKENIFIAAGESLYRLKVGDTAFKKVATTAKSPKTLFYADGRLWLGGEHGLFVYDGATTHNVSLHSQGMDNAVRQIQKSGDGYICVLTRRDVSYVNAKTFKVESLGISHLIEPTLYFSKMVAFGDSIFIDTKNNGVFVYDSKVRRLARMEGAQQLRPEAV